MEQVWRSIAAEPEKLESPAWHKPIIKRRLAKIEAGKGAFLTLAQFKKRLRKRAGKILADSHRLLPECSAQARRTGSARTLCPVA